MNQQNNNPSQGTMPAQNATAAQAVQAPQQAPIPGAVPPAQQAPPPMVSSYYGYQQIAQPYAYPYTPVLPKPKQPFTATRIDAWFAVASFFLGYFFVQWLLFSPPWEGWGVTAFTVVYSGAVLLYARYSGIKPPKISWYWLGILLLCGVANLLWPAGSMSGWRMLLLFGGAVYWVASLFGGLMLGKSSNFFPMDALNLLFVVPFRNFGCAILAFAGFKRPTGNQAGAPKDRTTLHRVLGVGLGMLLIIPMLAILVPLLLSADSGNFAELTEAFFRAVGDFFWNIFRTTWIHPLYIMAAVPVGFYLCGLVAGLCHKRYSANFDAKALRRGMADLRILPSSTAITVLVGVCLLYVIFIGTQLEYFFDAFRGQRAEGFEIYSRYAREGFFELCRVAVINLGLLVVLNTICRKPRIENLALRIGNVALSVLTILLGATAFSKMALYIGAYGLSAKRVLTSVFILFLGVLCCAVIALQCKQFSILRFALVTGVAIVCALSLINLDGIIVSYNADRYIAGTLSDFDTDLLYNAGNSGVEAALRVYNATEDGMLQYEIAYTLNEIKNQEMAKDGNKITLAYMGLEKRELPPVDANVAVSERA